MKYLVWTIQALLAALFIFAGAMKLILPVAQMTKDIPMPGLFLRFIGVMEVLGGLGLVLPGLLKIRQELTPLAACGLVIIMIGATVTVLKTGTVPAAMFPAIVGLLLIFVAYTRWQAISAGGKNART